MLHALAVLAVLRQAASLSATETALCYDTLDCRAQFQALAERCPGRFCGRRLGPGDTLRPDDLCEACPVAHRSDGWGCVRCEDDVSPYGRMYLVYHIGVVLVLHLLSVDASVASARDKFILSSSAVVEVVLAALFAVASYPPSGTLELSACAVRDLRDFFPVRAQPARQVLRF
eukprot:TRINITY_DN3320_c0_g1_i1.p1 TRINITY_DN3320_c0_g1~~TRINITY_DN3320_c0_g1_i1.p1  ORF type:complete len:173 (+),score=20.85 TRINITY_DN3320_c0_g1_i1:3-521(+)